MTERSILDNLNDQLLAAVENSDAAACRDLLARGADVRAANKWSQNTLHLAASDGCSDICRILFKHGADVHAVDELGKSALQLAALYGHAAICILLLEHGGNPLIKADNGQTALDMSNEQKNEDCAQVIRSWLAASAARAARAALQEIAADTSLKAIAQ